MSATVPDTRGLYSGHVGPFVELGFFLIVVSMIACFVVEVANGTSHLPAMLLHACSLGTEISWCKL